MKISPKRNHPWTRDELILALDFYFRVPPWTISGRHPAILALSADLRTLSAHSDRPDEQRYRNANGAYMKLMNFQALDPSRGGRGLQGAGQNDRLVWDELSGDHERLVRCAKAIRALMNSSEMISAAFTLNIPDVEEAIEGAVLTRIHRIRERNQDLVKSKKHRVLETTGRLACEACDFDFNYVYGELGTEFIECHHTTPLHELPERKTTLDDLALVCANCHRMLHRRRKWLTIAELKDTLGRQKELRLV